MKIDLKRISVREVLDGYKDSNEEGVIAYGGKLDIRPKYQREFVYKGHQRDAVIETVRKGFPLNVMYWMVKDSGGYEVLDGQQRTLSICQYVNNEFSLNEKYFHSLTSKEKDQILDYELMVYWCKGDEKERLDWFRVINTAGETLTDQELLNAAYTGSWLSDAKQKFSKSNGVAYLLSNDGGALLTGSPIRQEYLETVLSWINDGRIEEYMSRHHHEEDADELWVYFQKVISWVRKIFPKYRKEMAGVEWGVLFNKFGSSKQNPEKLELEVTRLMLDDDVTNHAGIYTYVLSGEEKYLSIRKFDNKMKRVAYEKQKGVCPFCKKEKREKIEWEIEEMEADHITPWHEGGKTVAANCQLLCKDHNRTKSGK